MSYFVGRYSRLSHLKMIVMIATDQKLHLASVVPAPSESRPLETLMSWQLLLTW
jgi:hypothetical protein